MLTTAGPLPAAFGASVEWLQLGEDHDQALRGEAFDRCDPVRLTRPRAAAGRAGKDAFFGSKPFQADRYAADFRRSLTRSLARSRRRSAWR